MTRTTYREVSAQFYSDGLALDASFYLPAGTEYREHPLCLICSGFTGLKKLQPERFARALTKHGYACCAFDYRGFGKSEGKWNHILIEEQVRDIVNAAIFSSCNEEVKTSAGMVVIGWGMGAGLILEAARDMPSLKGLVCANGFYSATRVQKEVRGAEGWRRFRSWLARERKKEILSGHVKKVDPFKIYPLDPITENYVEKVLRREKGYGGNVDLTFAYSLLNFCPETSLWDLESYPLLIAHGDSNDLHPPTEAKALYSQYPGEKELYWIRNAGHTEWMLDGNRKFQKLVERIHSWILNRSLAYKKE